jgi:Carboxypeptidase regulatory-like domain
MKTRAAAAGLVMWLGACSIPSGPHNGSGGTVSGTVSSSQGGDIGGATVTVTPTGATSLAAVQTTASGAFTVDNVPTGDGNVTVSNLPTNCQATISVEYTGLKNGGTRVLDIVVPCSTTLPSRVP